MHAVLCSCISFVLVCLFVYRRQKTFHKFFLIFTKNYDKDNLRIGSSYCRKHCVNKSFCLYKCLFHEQERNCVCLGGGVGGEEKKEKTSACSSQKLLEEVQ